MGFSCASTVEHNAQMRRRLVHHDGDDGDDDDDDGLAVLRLQRPPTRSLTSAVPSREIRAFQRKPSLKRFLENFHLNE